MSSKHDQDDQPSLLCTCGNEAGSFLEYDEDGSLALARALTGAPSTADTTTPLCDGSSQPCDVSALNGSWFLQLTQTGPHTLMAIRGPMRIEVAPPKLRISGDIYVFRPINVATPIEISKPITENPMLFGKNWYPQFRIDEYSWYFRSLGVTYNQGNLTFKFERSLWNKTTQDFISQENNGKDTGVMTLKCLKGNVFTHPALPQQTMRLIGTAQIGGVQYDVVATKTSPFYRGCSVEVDVMTQRTFPLTTTTITGASIDFTSIYRTAGFDCAVAVDQTNIPADTDLSSTELQTALSINRKAAILGDDSWRLWLFVGSAQGDLFGLMFDDSEPFREGTAGFFDPTLGNGSNIHPSARNQKLGNVRPAFLRTLVHEAGHAFNLFHPKHDVHNVPIGTTIMNQTGDVMSFATTTNQYPGNITFSFDEHNRTSLIHSPDPQVRPGWKRFGFGHGSLSNGIAEPIDAAGLLQSDHPAEDLQLSLGLPDVVFRGEFVTAQFVLTNTGKQPREVSSAINLSRGDLRLLLKPPTEELNDVRDVIIACGDRPRATLKPGESLRGNAQIFYTNYGFTFRQTGRFYVSAELNIGDNIGSVCKSGPVSIVVRAPVTAEEEQIAKLSMEPGVGRAFAFGDYGTDQTARANLEQLADGFGHTETGAAAALTLANACSRPLRDVYSGKTLRATDKKQAKTRFDAAATSAAASGSPDKLVQLATAVAASTESNAPVLDMAADYLSKSPKTTATSKRRKTKAGADSGQALDLLSDIRKTFVQRK